MEIPRTTDRVVNNTTVNQTVECYKPTTTNAHKHVVDLFISDDDNPLSNIQRAL